MNIYKCSQNDSENIPKDIAKDVFWEDIHTSSYVMPLIAKRLKDYKKDEMCKIPFCTTLESSAFGAVVNLGDETSTPRIKEYILKDIDDLKNVQKFDMKNKRVKAVLESIKILKRESEIVVVNICGAYTVMSNLIDQRDFYKCFRRDKNAVLDFLDHIKCGIIEYAKQCIKCGADIISFSDSVGSIDIVGPTMFKEVVAKNIIDILKEIKNEIHDNNMIHVCGKTSTSLEYCGLCTLHEIDFKCDITYAHALKRLLKEDVKIVGHNCIKKTPYKLENKPVYKMSLK